MRRIVEGIKLYKAGNLTAKQLEVRDLALNKFESFIRLVAPYQLLSSCHIDLCKWIETSEGTNKLILWPRDHGKSRMAAFYAVWCIVRDPSTTIIYASATAEKAEEQLRFIKNILISPVVFKYFPELINPKENYRAAWNATNIIIDHPERLKEGVVDSTIMTCGLEKTITGKHCAKFILDDIVVKENNTIQGRKEVNSWVAMAASILSADSEIFAIGTRYHPKDAYSIMMDMAIRDQEDEQGNKKDSEALFLVNQANVEQDGEFLWPRQQRLDGKWFGFNSNILARKRAVYEAAGEITQFYAQYYNDPNDKSTAPISPDLFQYYDRSKLVYSFGLWDLEGRTLRLYAAIDLAASTTQTADYTVLIIGAIADLNTRYVVQIDRYRTDKISETLKRVCEAYTKWQFNGLRIESISGFKLVAQDLADNLNSKGIRIPIDLYIPPNADGKVARVNGILEPMYQSKSIWHYRGGDCQTLEEELISINPRHDDTKDAWAMCCDLMKPTIRKARRQYDNVVQYHPRWGGVQIA